MQISDKYIFLNWIPLKFIHTNVLLYDSVLDSYEEQEFWID